MTCISPSHASLKVVAPEDEQHDEPAEGRALALSGKDVAGHSAAFADVRTIESRVSLGFEDEERRTGAEKGEKEGLKGAGAPATVKVRDNDHEQFPIRMVV